VSLNVHACASLETFADEIVERAASRVFARSPFGSGHESEVEEADALVAFAPEPHPASAPVGLLLEPLEPLGPLEPPQAASARAAAIATPTRTRVSDALIGTSST
jgi:hypothetical protein